MVQRRGPVSVVVPVLNEATVIERQLEALRVSGDHEIVVVDGGSDDGTLGLVEPYADILATDRRGLAAQLNTGAAFAHGDVILFAYADTTLPSNWSALVTRTLSDARTVGGAFRLGFDSPRLCYRLIARVANLRNEAGCGPMGDQGLFVRKKVFEEVGGFDHDALLEDLDFVFRLRSHGRVVVVPESVRASVRQWEANGVLRTLLRNWWFLGQHFVGNNGPQHRRAYQNYRVGSHGNGHEFEEGRP